MEHVTFKWASDDIDSGELAVDLERKPRKWSRKKTIMYEMVQKL